MPENWPVNIKKTEILRLERSERPDGYSVEMAIRSTRSNNTVVELEAKTSVTDSPGVREWVTETSIRGLAALNADQQPTRIKGRIVYGDVTGDTRADAVEITTTFRNGRSETIKTVQMAPVNPVPKPNLEQSIEMFSRIFSGKPFDRLFLGQDPEPKK